MASMNLKCLQVCTSRAQACRQLLVGRKTLIPFSRQIGQLGLYHCTFSALRATDSLSGFPHAFCRNYHMEVGNNPCSVMGAMHLHGEVGDSFKGDSKWIDEHTFLKELHQFHSYRDMFNFVSSLEHLSDTMVAAVFQQVCKIAVEDDERTYPEKVAEEDVFKSLCFQLEQESPNLSDSALVRSLYSLIKLRVDPWSTLIVRLVSESQERLDKGQMTVQNLCILGESLFDLEGPGCAMLEQIMDQVQNANVENWTTDDMAMVYSILKLGIGDRGQYHGLLNKMNSFALTQVSQLSPKLTSAVLHALVVLDQTQAIPLVIKLGKRSVRHIPHFTDDEIINVLEAFIHFGQKDQFFIEALERHVAKRAFTMRPKVVSKVMQFCNRKCILSKTIFNTVAESFIYNADTFTTTQIAELMIPFGKLNYLPPCAPSVFRKLEKILIDRFAQFQPHVLLNLLHACTLVQRYPLNFLAKVFNPYFLQQLQAEGCGLEKSVCSQLTQLFLAVTLECPSYEGPKLPSKYRVKSLVTPGHSLESALDVHFYSRVKAGLIDLLGARIYFASRVLTPYCYTLDIEIKLSEEGFVLPANQHEEVYHRIALCVDDPKRFCTTSHNLLGKEAIKQRHLQLLGYETVQIPFFEFEVLRSRSEIVDYLHKKIFPNSYRLSW